MFAPCKFTLTVCVLIFTSNIILFLGHWLRITEKKVLTLFLETNFFLEELHEICDHMSGNIQSGSARFSDLAEIVEYLRKNDNLYPDINCICEFLKKSSFNYPKKCVSFKKFVWRSKEMSSGTKKIWILIKNITCLIKKSLFCCLAPYHEVIVCKGCSLPRF